MRTLIRFLLWTALFVGVILGLARATAFRWFQLPINDPIFETSVLPTLHGGDWVVTWRLGQPAFGDLVVCPEPDYPERYIIGRIVGESGDSVKIINGEPSVGNQRFVQERGCDPGMFSYPHPANSAEEVTQQCHWESIANHLHKVGGLGGQKIKPEDRQTDVTEGMLFLISDNRLFPYDSRDYGLVEASTCKERVVLRLVGPGGWMDSENRLNYIQ